MLSILIPVYNYDVTKLVKILVKQCQDELINYEVIVLEDGSTEHLTANKSLDAKDSVRYFKNDTNKGRSAIKNEIASFANYSNLLFLDADTIPKSPFFIKNYILSLAKPCDIVCGGIEYLKEYHKSKRLRYIYGINREAKSIKKRIKEPYLGLMTANFLIKKFQFEKIKFNETIGSYGYEDTVFALDSKDHRLNILHIDNPVYHMGIEGSQDYLKKINTSIEVLINLTKKKVISKNDIKLSRWAYKFHDWGICIILIPIFNTFKNLIVLNLTSKNPSLVLLDLYKLGYFCNLLRTSNE